MTNAETTVRRHRVERVLAGAVLALLPLGNVFVVTLDTSAFGVLPAWFAVIVLGLHDLAQIASGYGDSRRMMRSMQLLVTTGVALFIPVLVASHFGSAAAAYVNFFLGLLAAVLVGKAWSTGSKTRLNAVDAGLVVFLVAGIVQLFISWQDASADTGLHQSAVTDWGGSNYVAGALVVGGLILIARVRQTHKLRILYAVAGLAFALSLLTYSRGAIVSLGLGAVVLLWNIGRSKGQRFLLRATTIFVPTVFYFVFSTVSDLRFTSAVQSLSNVQARFLIYQLAWDDFLKSPLYGTGWSELRRSSEPLIGAPITFAHNLVLSFMQIGGLIGLFYVVLLLTMVVMCLRTGSPYAAAVVAAVGIALTDPFFEGFIGGTLGVAAIVLCLRMPKEHLADFAGAESDAEVSGRTSPGRLISPSERAS